MRELISDNADSVQFFAPDVAYADARKCAMTIGCAVWTADADFFGTGIATWTSDMIELYLSA